MKSTEAALQREADELLRRAQEVDDEEDRLYGKDRRGDELPDELAHKESRLKKIREAMAELKAEAEQQARAEGKDPTRAEPDDKAQRNFTDPESTIQKQGRDYVQGYNAQVAVDEKAQIIVSQHVTPIQPDVNQLLPVVQRISRLLRTKPRVVLADAGYWSEENVVALEKMDVDPFIATQRRKHSDPLPRAPRGRPPGDLSPKQRMARKLLTIRGRATYAWRQILPEPVFGQIKHARGFRQFLRRGLRNVGQEWAMICTVHNLLKLHGATS
jgi:IS5 family transposase